MQTSEERFKKVQKIGASTHWSQDFYHYFLIITWPRFFLSFVGFFIFFNMIFGLIYWALPSALSGTDGSYFHAVLFSVQTYSTIGYGSFVPVTTAAHVIVVIQTILTLFSTAALTGLIFAKFSRPRAKILFSKNALVNQFDGKKTLMFRMGNLRDNHIAEAQVRMVALQTFKTLEGETIRRQVDLNVKRNMSLFFALSWLVIHEIDESSPLFGLKQEEFITQNIEIAVSVIGNDSTFAQTVTANCIYSPADLLFDRYFEDVIETTSGRVQAINYKKFHDLKS